MMMVWPMGSPCLRFDPYMARNYGMVLCLVTFVVRVSLSMCMFFLGMMLMFSRGSAHGTSSFE
jgi:hypothetical protein